MYPTPSSINYTWSFGALAGLSLVIQIVSGIFLAMYYSPHIDTAFYSVEHIMRDVSYGWFFRYVHSNGASMFFFTLYGHIGKNLFIKAYCFPYTKLWYSGIIIFLLSMATAFMGYVLPWGQMSFWGATVITNFFTAIPVYGDSIASWLWGGFSVEGPTLNRFFSLHYLLPFVIVGIVFAHLSLLHVEGSSNPLLTYNSSDRVPFYPYSFTKDLFSLFVYLFVFTYLVFFAPNLLGHPDNYIEANVYVTPEHIVPEWYFLPFYTMLRAIPNKLGGLICMVSSLLVFFILPFTDKPNNRAVSLWSIYRFFFYTWVTNFFLLVWLGSQPMEYPFIELARGATFLYFFILLFIFPFLSYCSLKVAEADKKIPDDIDLSEEVVKHTTYKRVIPNNVEVHCYVKGQIVKPSSDHPFHMVTPSPWPFSISLSLFQIVFHFIFYLHDYPFLFPNILVWGIVAFFSFCIGHWFYDIVIEATFEGHHTIEVQQGIRYGMLLFILSEVMFFFSFFWAFFYFALNPSIWIGCVWPPIGIETIDPFGLPLLNTIILLSSGISVTLAHRAIAYSPEVQQPDDEEEEDEFFEERISCRRVAIIGLLITIFLGIAFTICQLFEYHMASFSISDGIYGSLFYVITGFHGVHVVIGTVFLIVCFFRHVNYHFLREQHVGLECAIWYWHFVDIIWLFSFVIVYWWGS